MKPYFKLFFCFGERFHISSKIFNIVICKVINIFMGVIFVKI